MLKQARSSKQRKPSVSNPVTQIPSLEATFVGHGLLVQEKYPETAVKGAEIDL